MRSIDDESFKEDPSNLLLDGLLVGLGEQVEEGAREVVSVTVRVPQLERIKWDGNSKFRFWKSCVQLIRFDKLIHVCRYENLAKHSYNLTTNLDFKEN